MRRVLAFALFFAIIIPFAVFADWLFRDFLTPSQSMTAFLVMMTGAAMYLIGMNHGQRLSPEQLDALEQEQHFGEAGASEDRRQHSARVVELPPPGEQRRRLH